MPSGERESATMAVSRRVAELRREGVEVFDLGAGEPDFPSPETAVRAARRALDEGRTKYTVLEGTPELRAGLAARYGKEGAPWSAANVLVTVGAKAALYELAQAFLSPGDEVVVPTPAWVSIPAQVRLAGATVVTVPMAAADGFAIRAQPLIDAMSERTRAVVINSPCNPTGAVAGVLDLERVARACAERGALLISDETYERFIYDGQRYASVASLAARYPETVVLVGSFSKTYAMTGWRLGYLLGAPSVIAAAAAVQSHVTSNATSFAMAGAEAVLEQEPPEAAALVAACARRRALVLAELDRIPGVVCPPPAGAFYAFPDVSAWFDERCPDSAAFCRRLLDEAGVATTPGSAFGCEGHIRLSYACSDRMLTTGLERMAELLGARRWRAG
ncbi:MAG: pyridoxal phosphate-dependent aminotransferase [Acidobacteria bacterium]|nr:pyridoxal phosphate-dependent aminotransferase [Acidobacteriota bacterium]